jgi:UDP-2,3-diacylglucosamine pyrophosphatase LpxH
MEQTHTLILSDFHLGSKVSQSEKIIELLKKHQFRKLILLGDIFENLNFKRLQESDWELLSLISEFSKEKKVRWVEGNHDKGLTKIFTAFTGAKAHKIYKWKYKNNKYMAIHGHQFDNFLVNNAFLSFLSNWIYNIIQLFDFPDKRISRFIKRNSKGWLRISEKVAFRAMLFAKINQVDFIFCGHTHKAMHSKNGKTHYYNSGCWTDTPCSYITLDKDKIEIHKY